MDTIGKRISENRKAKNIKQYYEGYKIDKNKRKIKWKEKNDCES